MTRCSDVVTDILNDLRTVGLTLWADRDGLRVGPSACLTDEIRAAIREHKGELCAAVAMREQLRAQAQARGWPAFDVILADGTGYRFSWHLGNEEADWETLLRRGWPAVWQRAIGELGRQGGNDCACLPTDR
jgi:hypothetical protein